MEVKIQILTIIPSIKELKENPFDIISIIINYDSNNNQFCISNVEKAILNKEIFSYKILLNKYQIIILHLQIKKRLDFRILLLKKIKIISNVYLIDIKRLILLLLN